MKMTNCKACGAEIATSAKSCPKCGAKNKKPIWKRVWIWILVVFIAIAAIGGSGSNDTSTSTPEVDNVTEAIPNTDNEIDGKLCEIISAEVGGTNYEGKPTVVITYSYTNNSDNASSFDVAFTHTVFQNGIECSPDYLYDEDNASKEIRPGTTIEVKKSYILNDTTTDIEVEVAGFISWDDSVITKTFSIT